MPNSLDGNDIDLNLLVQRVSESPDCLYPLYDIWQKLVVGTWEAAHSTCSETTCHLVVRECVGGREPVRPHQLDVLERMLHGDGQKILALDMGLACSTVAATAKQALASLGLECLPSRVPLALVLIGQASRDTTRVSMGKLCRFSVGRRSYSIVGLDRPDRHLAALLPPAEVEVMRARIEGKSHELIARLRRTSQRTIANQLASASRRLGVSGRLEIIGHLSQQPPMLTPLN